MIDPHYPRTISGFADELQLTVFRAIHNPATLADLRHIVAIARTIVTLGTAAIQDAEHRASPAHLSGD